MFINTTNIEAVAIQLTDEQVLVAAYQRPQDVLLEQDLDTLFNLSTSVLIMCDLNSKHPDWNCTRGNMNGNLHRYLENNTYVLLPPDSHTHYPNNLNYIPSTIDLVLLKNLISSDLEVIHELDSDHLPILLKIMTKSHFEKIKIFHLNYKKADWKKYIN